MFSHVRAKRLRNKEEKICVDFARKCTTVKTSPPFAWVVPMTSMQNKITKQNFIKHL